jgi:hypothetical protein
MPREHLYRKKDERPVYRGVHDVVEALSKTQIEMIVKMGEAQREHHNDRACEEKMKRSANAKIFVYTMFANMLGTDDIAAHLGAQTILSVLNAHVQHDPNAAVIVTDDDDD